MPLFVLFPMFYLKHIFAYSHVFEDQTILNLNKDLENYIIQNNYYEHQKKKGNIDNNFSDLKSGNPQIFGIYWSKAQIEVRHSHNMNRVKKWLNHLWIYENEEYKVFNPNKTGLYQFHSYGQYIGGKTVSSYLGSSTLVID